MIARFDALYFDCSIKKRICKNGPESSQYHKEKISSAPHLSVVIDAASMKKHNM